MYACEFPSFTSPLARQLDVYTPQYTQKRIDKVKHQLLSCVVVAILLLCIYFISFFFYFSMNALFTLFVGQS